MRPEITIKNALFGAATVESGEMHFCVSIKIDDQQAQQLMELIQGFGESETFDIHICRRLDND